MGRPAFRRIKASRPTVDTLSPTQFPKRTAPHAPRGLCPRHRGCPRHTSPTDTGPHVQPHKNGAPENKPKLEIATASRLTKKPSCNNTETLLPMSHHGGCVIACLACNTKSTTWLCGTSCMSHVTTAWPATSHITQHCQPHRLHTHST